MRQVRDLYPDRFGVEVNLAKQEPQRMSFETFDEPPREVSYEVPTDDFDNAGDNECHQIWALPECNSHLMFGYALGYEYLIKEELETTWKRWYGAAEMFELKEVSSGVFDRMAEWKNDKYHIISHFNSSFDAVAGTTVLECQLQCDLTKATTKQQELLLAEYRKLLSSVQVK